MIALGYFLQGVSSVLGILFNFFYFLVIARCVLSFVSPDPRNQLVHFVYASTEPLMMKVRRYIPQMGMMDLSPIILIAIIYFLNIFLVGSLYTYGQKILLSAGV